MQVLGAKIRNIFELPKKNVILTLLIAILLKKVCTIYKIIMTDTRDTRDLSS
jgi:hypothetical protein